MAEGWRSKMDEKWSVYERHLAQPKFVLKADGGPGKKSATSAATAILVSYPDLTETAIGQFTEDSLPLEKKGLIVYRKFPSMLDGDDAANDLFRIDQKQRFLFQYPNSKVWILADAQPPDKDIFGFVIPLVDEPQVQQRRTAIMKFKLITISGQPPISDEFDIKKSADGTYSVQIEDLGQLRKFVESVNPRCAHVERECQEFILAFDSPDEGHIWIYDRCNHCMSMKG